MFEDFIGISRSKRYNKHSHTLNFEIGAMLASAGGMLAGGKAAEALMGGSNSQGTPVAQADPQVAINYFKQAAQAQAAGYDIGLGYYGTALNTAASQIQSGYDAGNATLKPMSSAANQALNEQLRFMGLDPIQATAGYGQAVRALQSMSPYLAGTGAAFTPAIKQYASELGNMFDNATSLRDKDARIAAKQEILNYMDTAAERLTASDKANLAYLNSRTPEQLGFKQTGSYSGIYTQQDNAANAQAQQFVDQARANYTNSLNKTNEQLKGFQQFRDQFNREYTDEYDAGYTAEQIANKVSQLPGYQFQLDQGLQALERNAAARGLATSSNSALAQQEYAQQQAQSYYRQYLGDLQGVVAQGAPFTAKIADNQINLGNALGQLSQLYGAAAMDTERSKADFLANTLMKSGEVAYDASRFNANSTNTATQKELDRQSQERQQGMQTGGLLGAAQQKFTQQINANNNMARGYLYGSS